MQNTIKQILINSGVSKTQFAKDIEISKSYVINVINGKKKCSRSMYEKIRSLPYVSDSMKQELESAFYCETFGKKDYELILFTIDLIKNQEKEFNESRQVYIRKDFIKSILNGADIVHTINGVNEFFEITEYFASECLSEDNPFFFSNYSFEQTELDKILFTVFRDRDYAKEINFKHLVVFNNDRPQEIIRSVFSSVKWSRALLTTYKANSENDGADQLLPYYIISNRCVILFDKKCENGVVFTADHAIDYYSKLFSEKNINHTPISNVIYDEAACIGQSDYYSNIEDFKVSFGGIACLGPFLDYEILYKITPDIPNKDTLIRMLIAHYRMFLNINSDEYIAESSFWDFVEDGDIRVITDRYVSPCDFTDRIKILRNIYNSNLDSEKLNVKLFDESRIKLPTNLGIEFFSNAAIFTLLFREEPCTGFIRPYSVAANIDYNDSAVFKGLSEKMHMYFEDNQYALSSDMCQRAFERMIAKCEGMKNDLE